MPSFSSPQDQSSRQLPVQTSDDASVAERTPAPDAIRSPDITVPGPVASTGSIPEYVTIQMTAPAFPDDLPEELPRAASPSSSHREELSDLFPFEQQEPEELPEVFAEFPNAETFSPSSTYDGSSPAFPEHVTLEIALGHSLEETGLPKQNVPEDDKDAILNRMALTLQQSSPLPPIPQMPKLAVEGHAEETLLP